MEVKLKKDWGRRPKGALISVSTDRAYYLMCNGWANPDAGFMAEYETAVQQEKADEPAEAKPAVAVTKKTPEEIQSEIDRAVAEQDADTDSEKAETAKAPAPKKASGKKAAKKKTSKK